MERIADRLMAAMRAANTTYVELADRTGISKSALQRYATGETEKIPLDRLESIADALNVSAAHLLGWDENNPPAQVDEGIWKTICADSAKLRLVTWIATLDQDTFRRMEKILDAAFDV
ncbi:helix-turn-helix domain-containing protein [Oscillibacter sp. MSJ-2]|uniref:Helix-turn-helix domain-containing protein n=1 Tax=Dysosmobacter acutus TaxID=2841504 RepID=A0ABS6FBT9_9FIRM|nr:helix-turn-helix transcriptional regulator [Dysosmobacter acutus]MBU5627749.1 helix-turn-helix domain-containing protein [Dysosmobacter acutus]